MPELSVRRAAATDAERLGAQDVLAAWENPRKIRMVRPAQHTS